MNTNTINTVAAAEITVPKPVAVMTAQAFANVYDENGSYEPNPVAQTLGWSPSANPAIPVKHDNYVFRKDLLADVLAFLSRPKGDALYLTGPTGSGKTSVITEVAARLNWPVEQITLNSRFEFSQLKGQFGLVATADGRQETRFMHGPLATAMRFGHILLLNEVDLADPGELSGLNDVLEGRPLVIAENQGEIIQPHPMFRVVVTGNSAGNGDATGLYQGVVRQNIAALDRYCFLEVGYLDEKVEKEVLLKAVPRLSKSDDQINLAEKMVSLANAVRNQFLGSDGRGGSLGVTLSTRTLVRWAYLTVTSTAKRPLLYALERALLFRCEPQDRMTVLSLAANYFGAEAMGLVEEDAKKADKKAKN